MTREELMVALGARMIEKPDGLTAELTDEAIEGAVRWYDHERFTLGKSVSSGLLAWKLKQGGMAGFGAEFEPLIAEPNHSAPDAAWFRTGQGRERWIEQNVPDLEPDDAEAAVITLAGEKVEVTPELVRKRVEQSARLDADFYAGQGEFVGKTEPSKCGGPWISYVGRKP